MRLCLKFLDDKGNSAPLRSHSPFKGLLSSSWRVLTHSLCSTEGARRQQRCTVQTTSQKVSIFVSFEFFSLLFFVLFCFIFEGGILFKRETRKMIYVPCVTEYTEKDSKPLRTWLGLRFCFFFFFPFWGRVFLCSSAWLELCSWWWPRAEGHSLALTYQLLVLQVRSTRAVTNFKIFIGSHINRHTHQSMYGGWRTTWGTEAGQFRVQARTGYTARLPKKNKQKTQKQKR